MTDHSAPEPDDTDPGEARPGRPGTVGSKLREALGEDIDPGVSLDGGPAPSGAQSPALESLVGKNFKWGRYEHQEEVARGGMGAILKVWDGNLRRQLAMKVLLRRGEPKEGSSGTGASVDEVDPKLLSRFLEEAQVTGQLDHPGIVPVHELGLDENGAIYFTMRLVKGRELAEIFELVRDGSEGWSQTRALGVMLKVCEAMAYAHDKGVIHRDLKPANIMVGRFGEVYVMDWGLARVIGKPDLHDVRVDSKGSDSSLDVLVQPTAGSDLRTMDGDIVGTPAYMAPEQARGKVSELGPRADVYAVGAMLYDLLAGTPPHKAPGEKISPVTLLLRVREGPPDPLVTFNPDVQGELEAICEKAMAREEADRYEDMQDLAVDLRAYLEHRVVKAYERGAVAEIRKWISRNKAFATASAVALGLLVVGLAVSAMLYVRAERSAKLAETRREEAVENEQKAIASEQLAMSEKERADESAVRARQNEELAIERRAEAEKERVKVLRLSDVKRLSTLEADAALLWPATPERLPAYDAWLERAEVQRSRLELHREALNELRAGAIATSDDPESASWTFASTEER